MPVTAADQQKKLIQIKVGEHSGGGPVAASIDAIWDMYADKQIIDPRAQYFYALRDAIDIYLGLGIGAEVRIGTRMVKIDSDKVELLSKMYKNCQEEIEKIEKRSRASQAPAVGSIAATAPITPASDPRTVCSPDPNSRRFRGDPLFPSIIQ